jgi:septin family protein
LREPSAASSVASPKRTFSAVDNRRLQNELQSTHTTLVLTCHSKITTTNCRQSTIVVNGFRSTHRPKIPPNMKSCGFDSLPTLETTRRTLHGLAFNLLVVGPTGIGKTTLINSLFDFDYNDPPDYERNFKDVELRIEEINPQNKSLGMRLTIIETKGFNNQLDRSEIYKPIVDYIEARYDDYMREELNLEETQYNDIADNRVHCCLYLISPTARGLKPIDLVTMKKLHHRVCLIPVIGRSDQLTANERQAIKRVIMKEITENGIEIYSPRDFDLPFAVTASDDIIEENGKRLRVRSFPWGRMYIDRDSDFPALRDLILKSRMLAMIETTNTHYEKFRQELTKEFESFYKSELEFKSSMENELQNKMNLINTK